MKALRMAALVAALIAFALPGVCRAADLYSYDTYAMYTGESITVAWDASAGATYYNLQLKHFEQDQVVIDPAWQHITNPPVVITLPRAGHWIVNVQACKPDTDTSKPDLCSEEWATSIESQSTNDRPWWVYTYVAPPTGGGIE